MQTTTASPKIRALKSWSTARYWLSTVSRAAPTIEPPMLPMPPRITMATKSIDSSMENASGEMYETT